MASLPKRLAVIESEIKFGFALILLMKGCFPVINAHKCQAKWVWAGFATTKTSRVQSSVNSGTYRRSAESASGWASRVPRCTDESSGPRSPAGSRPGPWCWCRQWQRSICVTTHQAQICFVLAPHSHSLLTAIYGATLRFPLQLTDLKRWGLRHDLSSANQLRWFTELLAYVLTVCHKIVNTQHNIDTFSSRPYQESICPDF